MTVYGDDQPRRGRDNGPAVSERWTLLIVYDELTAAALRQMAPPCMKVAAYGEALASLPAWKIFHLPPRNAAERADLDERIRLRLLPGGVMRQLAPDVFPV